MKLHVYFDYPAFLERKDVHYLQGAVYRWCNTNEMTIKWNPGPETCFLFMEGKRKDCMSTVDYIISYIAPSKVTVTEEKSALYYRMKEWWKRCTRRKQ